MAAERHHTELESEGRRLVAELASARRALGERDRARRLAEQREHAERAERLELQREVAALSRGREPADGRADAMAERIRELEADREALERRLVEAEHLRGAAQAARRRAEAELERRPAGAAVTGTAAVLGAEAELARAACRRRQSGRARAGARSSGRRRSSCESAGWSRRAAARGARRLARPAACARYWT